jgi:hypothetical protein
MNPSRPVPSVGNGGKALRCLPLGSPKNFFREHEATHPAWKPGAGDGLTHLPNNKQTEQK